MKKILQKIFPILLTIVGLAMVFYPWLSEYLYENRVDSIVNAYKEESANIDTSEKDALMQGAKEYNEQLLTSNVVLVDPFTWKSSLEEKYSYETILNPNETGTMGFVDIPKINVYLPIYHGTSNEVLEKGIGHMEFTSFPIGGENTHSVITGHTGLNSAKLFTDLTSLKIGDYFFIHVLNETIAYQVCEINVVEPHETSYLSIQTGRDIVTMVTCTPYGVNSHRLLVTGERTEYTEEVKQIAMESVIEEPSTWQVAYKNALLIGVGVVAALTVVVVIIGTIKKAIKKRKVTERAGDGI